MQTLNRRTNLHPLIPTILPVQLLATIVQLSPSILLNWSSKISNNLGSLVSNQTSLHKSTRSRICFTTNRTERYRPSVQLLYDWSHTQSSICCNLMEDDDLVKDNTLIPIFHPNCIQSVLPKALLALSMILTRFLSCVQLLWLFHYLQRNPHIAI